MKDNYTPEEKLLALIKGQKRPSAHAPQAPAAAAAVMPEGPGPREKGKFVFALPGDYSWLSLSRILSICLVVSCAYLTGTFLYSWFGLKNIKMPQIVKQTAADISLQGQAEKKPITFYQTTMTEKHIFASSGQAEADKPLGIASGDMVKDFSLVGIISGANPQAIVEDKKSQKTYYVNKGQAVGEFQVEDILEGKIILNYNGQRYELYL